jgi:dipeptidase
MCDTVVVTGDSTEAGFTLFGKNSDREPNEAHHLVRLPASDHPANSVLECTYISIPQVEHTFEVILAKPFWMWGAEMGANEHGLVIGNEAVFTRIPYSRESSLLGMDLLRLALERANSAAHAVTVITELLDAYGQGGNCGYTSQFHYHNSFLIADPKSAWVLETAGPHWAAKQVTGVYTISNGLTLERDFDLCSADLIQTAITNKWCSGPADFSFRDCYSNKIYSRLSSCKYRRSRTMSKLKSTPHVSAANIMDILRDHGETNDPRKGLVRSNVCMHAGTGRLRRSQTTGSMVSSLDADNPTHFFTATAAPCTSFFKPVWTDTTISDSERTPGGTYTDNTIFWQHEKLHRSLLKDFPIAIGEFATTRDDVEKMMIGEALAAGNLPERERSAISQKYFEISQQYEEKYHKGLQKNVSTEPALYKRRWRQINAAANMPGL